MSNQDDCELPVYFMLTVAFNIFATIILGAAGMLVHHAAKAARSDSDAFSGAGRAIETFAIAGSLSYVPMVVAWFAAKKMFKTQNNISLSRAAAFLIFNTATTTAGCALASKSDDEHADFKPVLYFFISAVTSFSAYCFYLQQRQIENLHAPYGNENEARQAPEPNNVAPQPI